MSEMSIKPADSTMYDRLINIWEKSVRATHHFLLEEDIVRLRTQIKENYFPMVELYIACDEHDQIGGFIGISGSRIEMLFVDPHFFRQGIGTQLLLYALKHKAVDEVDVNEDNPEACQFYKRMGFTVIARSDIDGEGRNYPILTMRYSQMM